MCDEKPLKAYAVGGFFTKKNERTKCVNHEK